MFFHLFENFYTSIHQYGIDKNKTFLNGSNKKGDTNTSKTQLKMKDNKTYVPLLDSIIYSS